MKKIAILLFALNISLFYSQSYFKCLNPGETAKDFFARISEKPIVMAHRMSPLPKGFAENSLETFRFNLKESPCTIQEIDVRMTKDGKMVMLHDETLDRTSTGKGNLSDFTWSEIQKLSLKDESGNILKNHKIPALKDILKAMNPKTIVVLDKKPGTDPEQMMKEVEHEKKLQQIVVICYNIDEAKKLHAQYPGIMLALGFNSLEQIEENRESKINPENIIALVPQKIQAPEFYKKIHQMKIPISFSAQGKTDPHPNSVKMYKKMHQEGMKIICTDSLNNIKKAFR